MLQPPTPFRSQASSRSHGTSRIIRASEYQNLRQIVPSLRRQRDVDKVEVVTEAARYIDHLHKTLIERFMRGGIPDSFKDILGTSDPNELSAHHIKRLVTQMAAKDPNSNRNSASSCNQNSNGHLRLHTPARRHPCRGLVGHRRPLLAIAAPRAPGTMPTTAPRPPKAGVCDMKL